MRITVAILLVLLVSSCTTAGQRRMIQECKDEGYIPRTKEFNAKAWRQMQRSVRSWRSGLSRIEATLHRVGLLEVKAIPVPP